MNIGIWWDNGTTLVALSHPHLENSTVIAGRDDSHLTHVASWRAVAQRLGMTPKDEYFSIPRGRVIYDSRKDEAIIYHGRSYGQDRLELVASEFALERWTPIVDIHYAFGRDADAVFEEFEDDYDDF
jgi:hypothetical protein